MADIRSSTWSTTAGDNNASPPDGWPEGQSPSSVNNCAREMMAAIKRAWNDDHPVNESAGSNSAYTLVTSASSTAYATGDMYVFRANHASVGTSTLNVNGIGARIIKKFGNQDTIADDIKANQIVQVAYEPSADVWQLLTAAFAPNLSDLSDVDLSGGADTGDSLVYDGSEWAAGNPDPLKTSQITHPDNTDVANIRLYDTGVSQFLGYLYVNGSEAGGTGLAVLELTQSAAEIQNTQIVQSGGLTYFTARNGSSNGDFYFRGFNGSTTTNFMLIGSNGQQSSVIPGGSTLYPEYKCRAWVNFDGTAVTNPASTTGIRASGNVSSILDNGTGDYTVNFTTAMLDVNYALCGSVTTNDTTTSGSPRVLEQYSTATMVAGSVRVRSKSGGGVFDAEGVFVSIFR